MNLYGFLTVTECVYAMILCMIFIDRKQKTPEGEILDYLKRKTNYFGTEVKPLLEANRTMTLWYGLRLIQLDLDEKSNVLTTSVWTRQV